MVSLTHKAQETELLSLLSKEVNVHRLRERNTIVILTHDCLNAVLQAFKKNTNGN